MPENPWINVRITLNGTFMHMSLINGTAGNKKQEMGGIGIGNAKRRLTLLYNGRHDLQIREEEEVYIVNLKIQLSQPAMVETLKTANQYA